VAFARKPSYASADLFVADLGGGNEQRLTREGYEISGLTWAPGGKEIVYSGKRGGSFKLWRVTLSGGLPRPLLTGAEHVESPVFLPQSSRDHWVIAFEQANPRNLALSSTQLVGTSDSRTSKYWDTDRDEYSGQFSPDGGSVAFVTDRNGSAEIMIGNATGEGNPVRCFHADKGYIGSLCWSPDSRSLAFNWAENSTPGIYVLPVSGGPARRLTGDDSLAGVPTWSWDGQWIYFRSTRSGTSQIWKMRRDGSEPRQITKLGGYSALEAPGGRHLYYAKRLEEPGLWTVPVDGGEERPVPELSAVLDKRWTVTPTGLFFLLPEKTDHTLSLWRFVEGHAPIPLRFRVKYFWSDISLSPDERRLLWTQWTHIQQNLTLAELR
jgi:Tol biopolymer transport system component